MRVSPLSRFVLLTLLPACAIGCTATSNRSGATAMSPATPEQAGKRSSHVRRIDSVETNPGTNVARVDALPEFVDDLPQDPLQGILPVAHLSEPHALPPAPAATIPSEPASTDVADSAMTLEQLEQLALEHNPSISQISASAHKADGIRTQVGLKPNPQIGYFGEEIGNESGAGLQGAFVSQTFVTGDKLEAGRRVLDQDYQSVLWEVEAQRFRVRTDVRTKFYEALAAQQRLNLSREFLAVANRGLTVANSRLNAQEGSLPDVLQAEIQLSEIEVISQRAAVEYQAAWGELAALVGLPDLAQTVLVGQLPESAEDRDTESLYQQLLQNSPELQAAYARINSARSNMSRQDLQAIPNVTGQIGVGQDNSTGSSFANVQLSLPIPVHNRNQGNIQAAYADYCRAAHDVERLELSIRARLVRAMRDYNQSRVSVEQYTNVILPKAKQSMDLSEQAYLAGEFDFLRVLVARRTYFETNLAYLAARTDLATASAQIDGLLLSGGLTEPANYSRDDSLRGQALSQQ